MRYKLLSCKQTYIHTNKYTSEQTCNANKIQKVYMYVYTHAYIHTYVHILYGSVCDMGNITSLPLLLVDVVLVIGCHKQIYRPLIWMLSCWRRECFRISHLAMTIAHQGHGSTSHTYPSILHKMPSVCARSLQPPFTYSLSEIRYHRYPPFQ